MGIIISLSFMQSKGAYKGGGGDGEKGRGHRGGGQVE